MSSVGESWLRASDLNRIVTSIIQISRLHGRTGGVYCFLPCVWVTSVRQRCVKRTHLKWTLTKKCFCLLPSLSESTLSEDKQGAN